VIASRKFLLPTQLPIQLQPKLQPKLKLKLNGSEATYTLCIPIDPTNTSLPRITNRRMTQDTTHTSSDKRNLLRAIDRTVIDQ
jgi:hypothetical protein